MEHLVEHRGVLGVPVPDKEPQLLGPIPRVHHQVAGLLGHPLPGRVGRGTQDVHPAGPDLHHEQHVDPDQTDGVHVQEIAGEDALGLRGQELGPGRARPSRRGADSGAVEDDPHGAGPDVVAQVGQFTLDAPAAPPRVLPRQPQHQIPNLGCHRWPARPPSRIGPPACDQLPVPP
jgi:hypothetical protein